MRVGSDYPVSSRRVRATSSPAAHIGPPATDDPIAVSPSRPEGHRNLIRPLGHVRPRVTLGTVGVPLPGRERPFVEPCPVVIPGVDHTVAATPGTTLHGDGRSEDRPRP